jgi:A/G-specific adenine glycosylase
MLQQTRAQAVIPYYERFLARFPTFEALAAAPEADVLAMWAGLGYYSRARNLLRAVQSMTAFPRDYEGIRALPGVGDYTAAAVASIAFHLPHAVLDGNVMRVIARVENDASISPVLAPKSASAPSHRTGSTRPIRGTSTRR